MHLEILDPSLQGRSDDFVSSKMSRSMKECIPSVEGLHEDVTSKGTRVGATCIIQNNPGDYYRFDYPVTFV